MEQLQSNNSTADQTRSVLSRAKSNIIPSTKKLVNETVEMITNPIQTAKSIGSLAVGLVEMAIPGEQGNEDTVRAVGKHFADRYGSVERIKETFATDPAGFAAEVVGLIGGGAFAAGKGITKATAKKQMMLLMLN